MFCENINCPIRKKSALKLIIFLIILISWMTLSLSYYDRGFHFIFLMSRNSDTTEAFKIVPFNESSEFLIDTPGCVIPNYGNTLQFKEAKIISKSCGDRAVFVEKVSTENFTVRIDEEKLKTYTKRKKYECCYQFVTPAVESGLEDLSKIRYTQCVPFHSGDKLKLIKEIIAINCFTLKPKKEVVYRDVYVLIKKINTIKSESLEDAWNVLIIGMDTMSRARFLSSMPETARYLHQQNWLDFRGYQKVGYNTFPNVMAFMTGKNMSDVHSACKSGMDNCNDKMLWSHLKKAGYITATGEDYLRLPDTFTRYNGYTIPPTDHYMRPFFLTGETSVGNLICTKSQASAKHILDYVLDLTKTYKNDKYFGMFWINSFSHNLQNVPSLFDVHIINFFEDMHRTGVLNSTFVFFLSDHGIRYGQMRLPYESYYEERLPMLHMWVPRRFRQIKHNMYRNLLKNQNRLVTPYDLYSTVLHILALSKRNKSIDFPEACPKCQSIFNELSQHRSCKDLNVDEKWCSCRNLVVVDKKNPIVLKAIELAVNDIQKIIKSVKTIPCMQCEILKMKTILRSHKYNNGNSTVYILAFKMEPGDVSYEANIEHIEDKFNIINPTETISAYNTRGSCVENPNYRSYCICQRQPNCKIKKE